MGSDLEKIDLKVYTTNISHLLQYTHRKRQDLSKARQKTLIWDKYPSKQKMKLLAKRYTEGRQT